MVEPTKNYVWTSAVIESLKARFTESGFERLQALLKETGSLIAGGSILSACLGLDNKKQDTDIYVPVKHIPKFLNTMFIEHTPIFKATHFNSYAASFYCESFLKKNGIRKVYNFAKGRKYYKTFESDAEIDIMAVRNSRSPLAVVSNFDLTFCQVWFDGSDVWATHPEHIRSRTGVLQLDYCRILLTGNRFLKKRIEKYTNRDFTIKFPENFAEDLTAKNLIEIIGKKENKDTCTVLERHSTDPVFKERWFNRIAMRWFLNIRDGTDINAEEYDESKFTLKIPLMKDVLNNQIVRLDKDNDLARAGNVGRRNVGRGSKSEPQLMDLYMTQEDDGYDSEEMDNESLKQLAVKHYVVNDDELAKPISEDLIYNRGLTNLYINSRTSSANWISLIDLAEMGNNSAKIFLDDIKEKCLHSGEDFLGNSGELFFIHNHPTEGSITSEGLEGYLETTMTGDEYDVKCFWTPEHAERGMPAPKANCQHKLTLSLIKAIVSPEFYERYSAPRPKKEGLDQDVGLYESVFRNVKTTDTLGYGDIYHSTMCPFCLKFEERAEGCAYMTHSNPKKLSYKHSPFCKNERNTGLIEKYSNFARDLGEDYIHLEFCVECGRPSINHKHFNLDGTGLIENKTIPDPNHPGQLMVDYGNCPGGGRQEMIARMLAVRDIYRQKDLRSVDIERVLAAQAANKAPLNPELMARANAILDMPPEKRAFNRPVPETKKYNDPLYIEDKNDEKPGVWNDPQELPTNNNARSSIANGIANTNNIVPNSAQKHWNQQNIDFLYHLIDNELENLPEDIFDKIVVLTNIANAEYHAILNVNRAQIDLNLVNALALAFMNITNNDLQETIKAKLNHAYVLGGKRVKNGIDPEIGYQIIDPVPGGKRKTYKRRKGLIKKKRHSMKK